MKSNDRRARRAKHRERKRGSPQAAAAPVTAASDPEPVSAKDLTRRYRVVGAQMDRLAEAFGDQAIEDLRQRFFAIRYAEALKSPAVRAEVLSDLEAINDHLHERRSRLESERPD